MGKEMKAVKEIESKAKVQGKDYRGLKVVSLLAVMLSFVAYSIVLSVNSYFYTPDFRVLYTSMLVASALFSLGCFVVCTVAVFKIRVRRYLYIIYSFITFVIMCWSIAGAMLFNFFR